MADKKKALLWKVEGKGLAGASYVFGTMHAHDSRIITFGNQVKPYLLQCAAFASEIDQRRQLAAIESQFFIPNGQTLAQVLPPAVYKRLGRIFPKYTGNALHLFERWLPMLIQNILTEAAFLNDSPESIDQHLWMYATAQQKQLLGLETHEEQQVLLSRLSLSWQARMLGKYLRTMRSSHAKARRIIAAYLCQDTAVLYKSAKKTGGKARKWLLYERNKIMAKRFLQHAGQQTLFAAIGAGHLCGGKGVLRLLQKAGFKVKAVMI